MSPHEDSRADDAAIAAVIRERAGSTPVTGDVALAQLGLTDADIAALQAHGRH